MTSTRLRKHAATLSTVLNMTDTQMDQLANFLGHDIRIHRQFYRLPEKTLQLAKISKVLMALEKGKLAEFHSKNLDEIDIDPDGVLTFFLIFFLYILLCFDYICNLNLMKTVRVRKIQPLLRVGIVSYCQNMLFLYSKRPIRELLNVTSGLTNYYIHVMMYSNQLYSSSVTVFFQMKGRSRPYLWRLYAYISYISKNCPRWL